MISCDVVFGGQVFGGLTVCSKVHSIPLLNLNIGSQLSTPRRLERVVNDKPTIRAVVVAKGT